MVDTCVVGGLDVSAAAKSISELPGFLMKFIHKELNGGASYTAFGETNRSCLSHGEDSNN